MYRKHNELKPRLTTKQIISDLSDLYNQSLIDARKSPVGKRDHLELIKTYIELKKLDQAEKTHYDWSSEKPKHHKEHCKGECHEHIRTSPATRD